MEHVESQLADLCDFVLFNIEQSSFTLLPLLLPFFKPLIAQVFVFVLLFFILFYLLDFKHHRVEFVLKLPYLFSAFHVHSLYLAL